MKYFALAVGSILISVVAQFSLKAGMSSAPVQRALALPFDLRNMWVIASQLGVLCGFLLYGLGAVLWLGVLARWDVSKAYPLVGFGFVLAVLIGWLSGEQVGASRLLGVTLICLGVALVGRS